MAASILAGMTILMIGDSHLAQNGYLITTLHDNLVAEGAKVHTLGVCGSKPGDWLVETAGDCGSAERRDNGKVTVTPGNVKTVDIQKLIAADKPNLVLVVLGDTMAGYKNPAFPKAWAWQQTTGLVKAIKDSGAQCAWVGPNWGSEGGKYGKTNARVQLTSDFLKANVAPCSYIDSLTFSKQGQWATIDGQHLTLPGYKTWGNAINKALLETPAVKDAKK